MSGGGAQRVAPPAAARVVFGSLGVPCSVYICGCPPPQPLHCLLSVPPAACTRWWPERSGGMHAVCCVCTMAHWRVHASSPPAAGVPWPNSRGVGVMPGLTLFLAAAAGLEQGTRHRRGRQRRMWCGRRSDVGRMHPPPPVCAAQHNAIPRPRGWVPCGRVASCDGSPYRQVCRLVLLAG